MGNSVTIKKILNSNWEVVELSSDCVGTMYRGLLVIARTVAGGCGGRARGGVLCCTVGYTITRKHPVEWYERSAAVVTVYFKADQSVLVSVCHVWPLAYPVRNRLCYIITCNSAQSPLNRIRSGMWYSFFSFPLPLFPSIFFPSVPPLTLRFLRPSLICSSSSFLPHQFIYNS